MYIVSFLYSELSTYYPSFILSYLHSILPSCRGVSTVLYFPLPGDTSGFLWALDLRKERKRAVCSWPSLNVLTQIILISTFKNSEMIWRDGSVVKSIDCSSRGPEFNSQHPHGGSQPSLMGSDALFFWCTPFFCHGWYPAKLLPVYSRTWNK